ncbi:RepA [Apiscitlodal virus]
MARNRRNSSSSEVPYRLTAKNIFLTYSQCFLPKEALFDFLKQKIAQFNLLFICVCFEHHQNGDPHLHAMLQLEKKLDTENPRFFDIPDPHNSKRVFHPSVEPLRLPKASHTYLRKDGDFIEEGTFNSSRRSPIKDLQSIWRFILDSSTDETSFYASVRELRPMDYVLRWPAIQSFARDHFQRRFIPYTPQFMDFPHLPSHVRSWAARNILCVSTSFVTTHLCPHCAQSTLEESEMPIREMHYYHCDSCRSPTPSHIDQSHSSSVDLHAQERLPGLDPWDYITISPEH